MFTKEIRNRIVFVIFSFFLLIPSILTGSYPDTNAVKIELREIHNFPLAPANLYELIRWPKLFDNYINDHFFLRSLFIKYLSIILHYFDISISKEVLIGKDGWLFLAANHDVIDMHRGIKNLSPEEVEDWINVMSSDVQFLKKKGIDFWFIIVPNKHSVYKQYLPDWCTTTGPSFTDTLIQKLRLQENIHWIDLRPLMIETAKKFPVYGKYDSHWDDMGAYIAYKDIMRHLSNFLNVFLLPEESIKFSIKRLSGGSAGLINLHDRLFEEQIIAEVTNSSIIYKKETKDYTKIGWESITSKSAARAAIFCDSFVNGRMSKYLQESFSYSFFKHHQSRQLNKELILEQHPNVVLYIIVERLIPSRLIKG